MKLTPEQVRQFQEQGYLIATNVLAAADLDPVIADISDHVDRQARQFHEQGLLADLHADKDFATRIAHLYPQCDQIMRGLDIVEMRSRAIHRFLYNDNLLDALEDLLGPEIICSPIQHLRTKLHDPSAEGSVGNFADVPWHQDAGVTWDEADQSPIITCWIALVDATRENGCMEIIPGVVGKGYLEHQAEGGTTIRPDLLPTLPEPICAEVPRGGIVFMSQFTPHRGLPNRVPGICRWSLDLRYQKAGTPTGRPFQPDFPVRSRDKSKVTIDYDAWCKAWDEALERQRRNRPPLHRPQKRAMSTATGSYDA